MHGGDAGEGLAGADRVRDQRALAVLDDARHGVALVLPELDVGRHARQREVVAAVGARCDAVELSVVDVGEHGRAVLVLPDPLAEGLLQLAALRVGRGRGDRVGDLLLGLARYGVVVGVVLLDLDEAAVERRGEDHEAVVGAHAPLLRDRLIHAAAGGRDAPPAGHLGVADLEASRLGGGLVAAAFPALVSVSDLEGLEREVADHRCGDPGASELAGDLPRHELDRLHGLETRFKALERRDAVRVGGRDGALGGIHKARPVLAEALQPLLGGKVGQLCRLTGIVIDQVSGAAVASEQVGFRHALIGELLLLDAVQVLDGIGRRPEGAGQAHAVLDARLPHGELAVGRADGRLDLDAGDRAEGLEILRPAEDARAASGEEGTQLLIGEVAVADEVLERMGGRLHDVLVVLAGIEVPEPAGEQVDQRVAG